MAYFYIYTLIDVHLNMNYIYQMKYILLIYILETIHYGRIISSFLLQKILSKFLMQLQFLLEAV